MGKTEDQQILAAITELVIAEPREWKKTVEAYPVLLSPRARTIMIKIMRSHEVGMMDELQEEWKKRIDFLSKLKSSSM